MGTVAGNIFGNTRRNTGAWNMEDIKIESIKIGDHALLIVNTVEGKSTLRSVMVDRAK